MRCGALMVVGSAECVAGRAGFGPTGDARSVCQLSVARPRLMIDSRVGASVSYASGATPLRPDPPTRPVDASTLCFPPAQSRAHHEHAHGPMDGNAHRKRHTLHCLPLCLPPRAPIASASAETPRRGTRSCFTSPRVDGERRQNRRRDPRRTTRRRPQSASTRRPPHPSPSLELEHGS